MFSYLVRRSHKRRGLQIYKRWNPWPSLSQVLSCNLKMGRKCGGCGGGRRGQCRLKMQLVESYRSPSPFPLSFDRSQPVCLDLRSCMGNQAWGIRLVESGIRENFARGCGIQGFGIRNCPRTIWPESKFHWQSLESTTWNPESKTLLEEERLPV